MGIAHAHRTRHSDTGDTVALSVEEQFLELICCDADLRAAETDAVIALHWSTPPADPQHTERPTDTLTMGQRTPPTRVATSAVDHDTPASADGHAAFTPHPAANP